MSYTHRGRHGDFEDVCRTQERQREHDKECEGEHERNREQERKIEHNHYPHYSSKCDYLKDSPERKWTRPRPPSPPPLPCKTKKRGTWDSKRLIAQYDASDQERSERDSKSRKGDSGQDYNDALFNSLLERKAKGERSISSKSKHNEDDSDTPSKNSLKKSIHRRSPSNRSPSNRPANEDDSLPPYTEKELECFRSTKIPQPFTYTQPSQPSQKEQEGREEQIHPRKVTFSDEQNSQFDSDLGFSVTVHFVPRFDKRK